LLQRVAVNCSGVAMFCSKTATEVQQGHLAATHCNTLQHTATQCNKLQQTATNCDTLQHTAAGT